MKGKYNDFSINYLAEFSDPEIEDEYFQKEVMSTLKQIRFILLIAGCIYFTISIYDYFYNEEFIYFIISAITRASVLIISLIFYLLTPKIKHARTITNLITVFEFLILTSYIFILYIQKAQGFTEQAMTIMIIVFVTYLLPNRWIISLLTSIVMLIIYITTAVTYIDNLTLSRIAEVLILNVLFILIAIFFLRQNNYYKRKQYAEWKIREYMSVTDALTDIYNRFKYNEELSYWCKKSKEIEEFSVIMFDIDFFKGINDTYGHVVGDSVLVQLSQLISKNIRSNDIFARWGGEEFALLLPYTSLADAYNLANRLREHVAAYDFNIGREVTISMGVASFHVDDEPITIIQRADQAMYYAKGHGRNRVVNETILLEKELSDAACMIDVKRLSQA